MNQRQSDRIWKALSDPLRRKILDLLAQKPRTTGELSAEFPRLSRFAVMKHLNVLVRARLVLVHREGKKRWNTLNPVPLQDVLRRWVGKYEGLWADAMLNIRDQSEQQQKET